MGVASPQVRHWTCEEYLRMAEAVIFASGERVELIEGEIVVKEPQTPLHATGVVLAQEALRAHCGPGFDARPQLPLSLGPDSEPEPDAAVVRGTARDYVDGHPTTATPVLEVADTTLEFDRGVRLPCTQGRASRSAGL